MLGVSMFWMTRVKRAADYLVAGQGLPWWILLGTVTATSLGTCWTMVRAATGCSD